MKWLVGVLVLFAHQVRAQESLSLGFQAIKNECAWYEGSFTRDGHRGPMREVSPKVTCRLVDGVGATCVLVDHGLDMPSIVLKGDFQFESNGVVIETSDGNRLNFRLLCQKQMDGLACLFQFWNVQTRIGYSCNLKPLKAQMSQPKKETPKPSDKKGDLYL